MNHFLDESAQTDLSKTIQLISENPLQKIKPSLFKQKFVAN